MHIKGIESKSDLGVENKAGTILAVSCIVARNIGTKGEEAMMGRIARGRLALYVSITIAKTRVCVSLPNCTKLCVDFPLVEVRADLVQTHRTLQTHL